MKHILSFSQFDRLEQRGNLLDIEFSLQDSYIFLIKSCPLNMGTLLYIPQTRYLM